MIGCLRTRVRKQPIIALYFESENEIKFYNREAWSHSLVCCIVLHGNTHLLIYLVFSYNIQKIVVETTTFAPLRALAN